MNLVLCFSCECSQGEYTWADKPVFQVMGKSPPVPLPLGKTLTEVIYFLISYRVTLLIYNIWRFIYWEEGHTFYKRLLTLFIPVFVSFRSPWEHQKTKSFLMVSAGSKGLNRKHEIKQNFGSFSVSSAEEKERETLVWETRRIY